MNHYEENSRSLSKKSRSFLNNIRRRNSFLLWVEIGFLAALPGALLSWGGIPEGPLWNIAIVIFVVGMISVFLLKGLAIYDDIQKEKQSKLKTNDFDKLR